VSYEDNIVSLGEGFTPLIPLGRYADSNGFSDLLLKDEGANPTGSFKARGMSLAVSMAKELGITELCAPTAGNAGGALAAYAASAGLGSHIYMPEDTPGVNIAECRAYGAEVHLVPGLISDAAEKMGREKRDGWFDVSTLKEPYRVEGKKTLGFELAEQLDWELPDAIIYPTGGGTGLIGMWKAFGEMEQVGWIGKKRPRMIAVQAVGCAPVVRAFNAHASACEFWNNASTIASGLRVPKPFADSLILRILAESDGHAVAVSDEDILRTIRQVSAMEGVLLCPEGAAAFAGLEPLVRSGVLSRDSRVVVFNTGSGLKYHEVLRALGTA
jgi:threonine synthase